METGIVFQRKARVFLLTRVGMNAGHGSSRCSFPRVVVYANSYSSLSVGNIANDKPQAGQRISVYSL
jgi:hypothetical protein